MPDQPENSQPSETERSAPLKRTARIELEQIKKLEASRADDDNPSVANDQPVPEKNAPPVKTVPPANHPPLTRHLDELHHRDWLRWLFIPVLLIGLGIIVLSILVNRYEPAPSAPHRHPRTIIVPQTTPVIIKPTPAKLTAPPAVITPVAEKHLAPPGVYYLEKHISVTTNDGVYGIEAGAQVLLLQKNGDTYHVTNGPHDFDVNASDVTNDLDLAHKIIQQTIAHGHSVEPSPPSDIP